MMHRPIRTARRAFAGAVALGLAAGLAVPVSAQAPAAGQVSAFTDAQKAEMGRFVREYLLANPEIIGEAVAALEKKQAEAQKVAQARALKESASLLAGAAYDTVAGNPQGDVTLVEFFDYNCTYCKAALADLQALVKADPKLRVVLKDLPVLGPDSLEAHRVAVAAKQQLSGDRAFEYHAKLLSTRGRVNAERATAIAREMGLDMTRLSRDTMSPVVAQSVVQTRDLSEQLGINGTPAYVIGDEVVSGAVGQGPLKQAVAAMRQCGRAIC